MEESATSNNVHLAVFLRLPSQVASESSTGDKGKLRALSMSTNGINSVRNKFDNFSSLINDEIDVLVIAETKIDSSFPTSQFTINGFKEPYRLDVYGNSGGIWFMSETASF